MIRVTDQLNREVVLSGVPKSIISTVPSQTELLFHLSLGNSVAGVTWFCVHPKEMPDHVRKVGGTKKLNLDEIRRINPDLIIANKEENEQLQIQELAKDFPVYISDIEDMASSLGMLRDIGRLTNTFSQCEELSNQIETAYTSLPNFGGSSVLYLIWKEPYMSAGTGTYIQFHLEQLGLENVVKEARYPEVSEEMISALSPEYIFLSSEPFPFKNEHIEELKTISPQSKILLVDGEMFSWYGNRILQAADYFKNMYSQMSA